MGLRKVFVKDPVYEFIYTKTLESYLPHRVLALVAPATIVVSN